MSHTIVLNEEKPLWMRDIAIVLGASVLIALFAPVSIRLPFSVVPIATQGHVCLFLGALLGKKRGALAVLAFLLQGALGLPVFANGSAGLLGPTGGYLLGYVLGAYVTGLLVERMKLAQALLLGNAAIYLLGLPWLATFIGFKSAIVFGFAPFILGDLLKLIGVGKALSYFRKA